MKYYFVETWEDLDSKTHRQFLFAINEKELKEVRVNKTTKITEVSFGKYVLLKLAYEYYFKEYKDFIKKA